jgi:hypothetical protein
MYQYEQSEESITKEYILSKVKQEDIFQMVFGYPPKEYIYVKSPFRVDGSAGCYFEWYKNTLYFIDWTVPSKRRHRDCFNAVQEILGLNFYQALHTINLHFRLSLAKSSSKLQVDLANIEGSSVNKEKKMHNITFKARPFNSTKDREFWLKYGINRENLIEDNIFPIVWYKIYSKKLKTYVVIRPSTRTYCIGTFSNRMKIYSPDIKGRGKWITNCTQNDIGGLGELVTTGDILVIAKSYKDYRVLKNQKLVSIWFQNEGMIPSLDLLIPIVSRFKKVYVFFDNDKAGLKAATKVCLVINEILPERASPISLPLFLLEEDIKDPSDLFHKKGEAHLTQFLHIKGLIARVQVSESLYKS